MSVKDMYTIAKAEITAWSCTNNSYKAAQLDKVEAAYKAYTEGKITARECYNILYNAY